MASPTLVDMVSRSSSVAKKKRWIQKAHLKEGAFTKKAEAAGESVREYAAKEKDAPGKTGKQARLAQTFEGMRHKRASKLYARSKKD